MKYLLLIYESESVGNGLSEAERGKIFQEYMDYSRGIRRSGNYLGGQALQPVSSEVGGLLALMLLHDSRRAARHDESGDLVTLEEQDRSRWDRGEIEEGRLLAEEAVRRGGVGFYALQAAIAAVHAQAAEATLTDWPQIAALYSLLLRLHPSPVVALNHAAAVAMAEGLERGLRLVEELEAGGELAAYHLLPAAKADILRRLGRRADAAGAYERALQLVTSDAERLYLERRLREVSGAG